VWLAKPTIAPEAQCLLAPRFTGVPKKRSLFLGVVTWESGFHRFIPESRRDGAVCPIHSRSVRMGGK
jgi:hypothetical protein